MSESVSDISNDLIRQETIVGFQDGTIRSCTIQCGFAAHFRREGVGHEKRTCGKSRKSFFYSLVGLVGLEPTTKRL